MRLVDEVAAEIEEEPTARLGWGLLTPRGRVDLRPESLEAALHAVQPTELVGGERLLEEQEVAVPPPVLEGGQRAPGALGRRQHGPGLFRAQRDRLVDDRCETQLEGGDRLRRMEVIGRRHHHQADAAGFVPELVGGGEHAGVGEVALRPLASLRVGGDDHSHLEARGRRHQRRVEDLARQPVPDHRDPDPLHGSRVWHGSLQAPLATASRHLGGKSGISVSGRLRILRHFSLRAPLRSTSASIVNFTNRYAAAARPTPEATR